MTPWDAVNALVVDLQRQRDEAAKQAANHDRLAKEAVGVVADLDAKIAEATAARDKLAPA